MPPLARPRPAPPLAAVRPRPAPPPAGIRPRPAPPPATVRCPRPPKRPPSGQASAEFVVLLPLILAILAVVFQALLAAQAAWEVRVAARAAARAHAFGGDPKAAARGHLRPALERGLAVRADGGGEVRVSVRIPTVLPALELGRASATSHFQPQNG